MVNIELSPEQTKAIVEQIKANIKDDLQDGMLDDFLQDPDKISFTGLLNKADLEKRYHAEALDYLCVKDLDEDQKLFLMTYWMYKMIYH